MQVVHAQQDMYKRKWKDIWMSLHGDNNDEMC